MLLEDVKSIGIQRSQQTMKTHFVLAALASLLAFAGTLAAQITSQVSPSSINANENLHLILESDGDGGWPDLSPLERDFFIVHRSSSSSVRSFNGRTSQRTTLRLTLRAKKSGSLTIPAITIGSESSQPHPVTVLGSVPENTPAAEPFEPMPMAPNWMMPQNGADWAGNGWSAGPGAWGPPGFGMPGWDRPGEPGGMSTLPNPVPAAAPAPSAPAEEPGETGYWPWLTGAVVIGWLLTSLWLWRGKQTASASPLEVKAEQAPAPQELPPDASIALIAAIRQAYLENDADAARQALLHWGAAAWPNDPPGNLSRLAARCPSQVQRHILKLEEALYSPTPIVWNEQPIWELLRDLDPARRHDEVTGGGVAV